MNNKPVAWMVDSVITYSDDIAQGLSEESGKPIIPLYTHPVKELTDEEINKLWAESHEDGIAMQQGFTTQQHYFAHLILRKAQEK
jgi:hypothetical protein